MSAAVNADPVNPNAQISKPNVNLQHGLATPEPTPGPDKNRVAAEAARRDEARNAKTQEVISEIERVIKCAENDYAGLLGVALDASDDTKLAAWRRLGCMTHAKTCSHRNQTTAFEKLEKAAIGLGVSEPFIEEVKQWDGEKDLDDDADDTDGEENNHDDSDHMDTDGVPTPTKTVKKIYDKTTDLMHQLRMDPENKEVETAIGKQNDAIREYNRKKKNPVDQWIIGLGFFKTHYEYYLKAQSHLSGDPENLEYRKTWKIEKDLIDQYIKINHLPVDWTVPDLDTYLRSVAEHGAGANNEEPASYEEPASHKEPENYVKYPWPTVIRGEDRVIGARRGVLLLERVEEGRYIRRLCKASIEESRLYEEKCISIKDDPTKLRIADGVNMAEVLWVTKSAFKVGQKRNPVANCCVVWKSGQIQVLTIAALTRAMGKPDAKSRIQTCCDRDGIDPPSAWRDASESVIINASAQAGSGQVSSGQVSSGRVGSGQFSSGQFSSGQVGSGQVGSGLGLASVITTNSLQQRIDLLENQFSRMANTLIQANIPDRLNKIEALLIQIIKGVKIEEDGVSK